MSETKIIDTIKIDDIEASILGATYHKDNGNGVSFGESNTAGELSFATNKSTASGDYSHSEGFETEATGDYAHAEGNSTLARGDASHASGLGAIASAEAQTAIGKYNQVDFDALFIVGNGESKNENNETVITRSNAFTVYENGSATVANVNSKNDKSIVNLNYLNNVFRPSLVGQKTLDDGEIFNDYGNNIAQGQHSHAEGANTKAGGEASHAEGYNTKTAVTTEFGYLMTGYEISDFANQKIIITLTSVSGIQMTHALAFDTDNDNLNTVQVSILEIDPIYNEITLGTQDDLDWSKMKDIDLDNLHRRFIYVLHHPELGTTPRNGAPYAHAEGNSTQALGEASHSEGKDTQATGNYSHAGGLGTIASVEAQTVIGKYNQVDSDALFIVGDGSASTPSNAFVVKTDGTVWAGTKNLTADSTTDNTIQNFKVSDNFINGTEVTRNEKTTFIYNYGTNAAGDTLFQYLNPPITHVNSYNSTELTKYPTVERWFGQPVYTCIINAGSTSEDSDGFRVIKCLPADCMVIRYTCFAVDPEGDWQYIPQKFKGDTATNEWWVYLYRKGKDGIRMHQRSDAKNSKFTIFLQVWYVDKVPQELTSLQA